MGARNKIKTVHIEYLNIDNRRLGQNVSKSKEKYLGKPSKKTGYFMTLCKIHLTPTHPTKL